MRIRDDGYGTLLTMLQEHPEFSGDEDNPCDELICMTGKMLWKDWEEAEKQQEDELPVVTHSSVDQMLAAEQIDSITAKRLHTCLDYPVEQAARLCDCSKTAIYNLRAKYGAENFAATHEYTKTGKLVASLSKEQLMSDITELGSIAKVAKKYGKQSKQMKKLYERHGINISKLLCDKQKAQDEQCFTLHKQGVKPQAIADQLGVHKNTVFQAVNRWQVYLDRRVRNGGAEVAYGRFALSDS